MAERTPKITVLLADDHTIVRQGLKSLLEIEDDISVVGQASSGVEAVELAHALRPSIIVMDIMMPLLNGIQATRKISDQHPEIKVIILSMSGEEEFVGQAIEAGVWGYLIKQTAASELILAIRSVHRGHAYLSPVISKIVIDMGRRQSLRPGDLTLREKQILQLIVGAKSNREISELLAISIKTVEKHRQHILDKLDLHDLASLTKYAIQKGIIRLNPESDTHFL